MTREQTVELIRVIVSLYPNWKPENLTDTVDTWFWALESYDGQAVKAALQIYIKTNNTGFAPSASQLIGCMYKPTENNQLSEGEAWELVKRAIQDGNYHAKERFDALPEAVQKAVGSANMIQQWAQSDSDEVNTVIASNFQRAYKTVLQRQSFDRKVPLQISKLVNAVVEEMDKKMLLEAKDEEN